MNVFVGGVDRAVGKDRAKDLFVGFEDLGDRNGEKFNTEILGERAGIGLAAFRRVGAGHGNAEDVRGAESFDSERGNDGRVHAATEADNRFGEAAFADIVARSSDESAVGVSNFVLRLLVNVALAGDSVEKDEVLFEGFGLCGDLTVRCEGDAGAVEDQRIVSPNLIDVDDRAPVVAGDRAKHAEAKITFIDGVRRSGDVQEKTGALGDEFENGIAGVHGGSPEVFVVPDIFADGDAELLVVEAIDVLAIAGKEIAGFIENVVGGKKHLALFEDNAALGDEGGFIGNRLPGRVVVLVDASGVADDSRKWHLGGDLLECFVIALDEGGTFEKIKGKIPADAEFGEDSEVSAATPGFGRKMEDTSRVAFKITDSGIELSEGDSHSGRRLG